MSRGKEGKEEKGERRAEERQVVGRSNAEEGKVSTAKKEDVMMSKAMPEVEMPGVG
jgi:hypothetical protein